MNPVTEYYKELLRAVDCKIDNDDNVIYSHDINKDPEIVTVKLEGKVKRLVLPTRRILKDGNWNEIVAFHPACESIVSGQSEVLNVYQTLISCKIHDSIQRAVGSIIALKLNKEAHSKLNQKQLELIGRFDAVEGGAEKLFMEIQKKNTGISGRYPIISIRLERGGKVNDEVFSRTATLIPHILNSKDSFCGIKNSSEKAKRVVRSLYEYVIPAENTYGSNSNTYPYLEALLECYYHTAVHLNKIRNILGKYSVMSDIPVSWYENLSDLAALAKRHLSQSLPGNVGIKGNINKPAEDVSEAYEELSNEGAYKKVVLSSGLVKTVPIGSNVTQQRPVEQYPAPAPQVSNMVNNTPYYAAPPQQPVYQNPYNQYPPMQVPQQQYAAPPVNMTPEQAINAYLRSQQPPQYGVMQQQGIPSARPAAFGSAPMQQLPVYQTGYQQTPMHNGIPQQPYPYNPYRI